jgi:GT2 family glycosyltransferase
MTPVAIVIATRNRAAGLDRTLHELAALPERPRVVVADNGSADATAEVVARHPGAQLLRLGRNLGCGARTAGAWFVTEPYVAFSDDDSWWVPGALTRAVETFERHPRLGLIAARVLVGPDERTDPVCAAMAASPLPGAGLPGPAVLGFVACGAIVRRDAFLEVGGFEARFGIGGEEELLALELAAAGWGLAYVEDVVACHHPSPSRDPARRRAVQTRNALWTAWLRRRVRGVIAVTAAMARGGLGDPAGRAGAVEAVRGLPWVLRERRPVGRGLEAAVRSLREQPRDVPEQTPST